MKTKTTTETVTIHKFIKFWRLQLKSVTSAITKIAIKQAN